MAERIEDTIKLLVDEGRKKGFLAYHSSGIILPMSIRPTLKTGLLPRASMG